MTTKLPFGHELLRKGTHVLALAIPAGMMILGKAGALAVLIPLSVVAVSADVLRTRQGRFARFIDRGFGIMMRPEEWTGTTSRPVLNGATWVVLSATLLTLAFPIDAAAPGLASFMIADAAAAVIGMRWGRHHWKGTPRTMEGSVAFATAAFLSLLLLPPGSLPIEACALASLIGAALEIPNWPVNDNIRVPFAMTAVLILFRL